MGELGEVQVVYGNIRGIKNKMKINVEIIYNEYNFVGELEVEQLIEFIEMMKMDIKEVMELRYGEEMEGRGKGN